MLSPARYQVNPKEFFIEALYNLPSNYLLTGAYYEAEQIPVKR
jgi:hypothetical protein